MRIDIEDNVKYQTILDARGLGGDKTAQKFLANTVAKMCDPYVPFQSGPLKNTVEINTDNITYGQPYAHYQYYGEAMGGKAPKHYTGKSLTYGGGGQRGKQWDKRMMADHGKEITEKLAKYVGGKAK